MNNTPAPATGSATPGTARTPGVRRVRRVAAALAVSALAASALTACGGDGGSDAKSTPKATGTASATTAQPAAASAASAGPAARITWGACPEPAPGASHDPRLTCGTLKVPLDYKDPGGRTLDVAVSRIATARPGQRRGVLLLNPGGPALGGLDMPGTMAPTLPKSVLDRYDLIGFDPRGVEHSTPQSCGLKDGSFTSVFPYPAADGSIAGNVAAAKAAAASCAAAGADLAYFTTANTARDMDRIRQALGEPRISYWGQSYGTYLGTVYRALFPTRTDRMILEGAVDAGKVWADQTADTWGRGMADRFPDAAAVAAAQNSDLGLGGSVGQVTRRYLALAARLDRAPAAVPGTQVSLTGPLLRDITYGMLLHNETLPPLVRFWKAAADAADGAVTAADRAVLAQILADTPGSPGVPADNQTSMIFALTCGDAEWPHDVDGYAARTAADRRAWPLTAGMPANIWPCAFWRRPVEPRVAVTAGGARDTLILQNRRDNATPWEGAEGLHRELGSGSAFVGVDNGGHYVYHEGSACADHAVTDFLATGRLPRADVYCTDVKHT